MYAEERQQKILEQARNDGRVDVGQLAEAFGVTTETARRDLTALERRGLLRRVHGGAIPVERLGYEAEVPVRDTQMVAEKERIAKAALDELPDGGAILLDAGTTTARLAAMLPGNVELTVVTNGLNIASVVAGLPNIQVLLLGGRVRSRTLATVDAWALEALAETVVDVAFIGANGVDAERGLTTPDPAEAAVKRAMVKAARRAVVLADHTKVGASHLSKFAELDDIDTFITDGAVEDAAIREVEAQVRVVRA